MLAAQVWLAQVGRVPLLLLDSYVEENEPALREVTDRLYGGGSEHRLRQELLLGIGGVRAVRAFCALTGHPQPEVFHTNEGHAGFLGLERIREYAQAGLSFDEAIEVCRAGTVFTTHTPVAAGIDRFPRTLIEQHFSGPAGDPALPTDRVLALGAETYPGGDPAVFNMAVMGMRLAQRVNGVSRLHGRVSRAMFAGLWPGFDPDEVPIGSITNGVHAATWVAPEIRALAAGEGPGPGPELPEDGEAWERVAATGPARLWEIRRLLRDRLVDLARERLRASWRQRGASDAELGWIQGVLDASVLTIGFARRVPSYKRLTLMLHDPERLRALLLDPQRPAQIVIAGKAHPADESGKQLIQQMVRFADIRGCAAPDRVPARLRHGAGACPGAGLRRVAEQPAPAAGGLRHLGHEIGAERRAQPVDQGRLVGRVVRRRERLADPVGGRGGGRRPPGRAGVGRPLRDDRDRGGAAVLRRRRRRAARPVAGDGGAHLPDAGTAGPGIADGP